jgi:hypothetical protein
LFSKGKSDKEMPQSGRGAKGAPVPLLMPMRHSDAFARAVSID